MEQMLSKEKKILKKIEEKCNHQGVIQRAKRVWVSIDKNELLSCSKWLKKEGFVHLSAISVSDWLEEKKFKLDYFLWSFQDKILLALTVKIDRKEAIIDSVISIWGDNAQAHEREAWEFFNIDFIGNHNLIPLFTDNWQGPPPFRKDFDWHKYVRENYYSKDNERERGYYEN